MSLSVMESVNRFGKKLVQVEKQLSSFKHNFQKVNTKPFSKLSEFSVKKDFPAFTDFLTGLNWTTHWEKEGVFAYL